MAKIDDISMKSWILDTFPEWGTWLNEEIEAEIVDSESFTMWWLGCTGIWIKTAKANICIDAWFGTGKKSKKNPYIAANHQMARMSGGKMLQPNLRNVPCVLNPFAVKNIDAVVSTHYHNDHMDINLAAAVLKNCDEKVKFIGPQSCVDQWTKWGVPEDRCVVVKPGDSIKLSDTELVALESFDRTALITSPPDGDIRSRIPDDMDDKAVNYLVKTSGGNLYHSGDSHYSNMYAKHGNEYKIDVALGSFGENPRGITDKMTSCDILRMAEALNTKVVIPFHYDIWSNFMADPKEISLLYEFKKYALDYKFKPFIWQVGGVYRYPADKDKREYHYYRGFDDCFTTETNLPYPSFL